MKLRNLFLACSLAFLFNGCREFPVILKGTFKITDDTLESVIIKASAGGRVHMKNEELSFRIDDNRTILAKRTTDKDFWSIKLNKIDLEPILKGSELFISSKNTGQLFDMKIIKMRKKVGTSEKKTWVKCLFRGIQKKQYDNFTELEEEALIQGRQYVLMEIQNFSENYKILFLDPGQSSEKGQFISEPRTVKKIQVVSRLTPCE